MNGNSEAGLDADGHGAVWLLGYGMGSPSIKDEFNWDFSTAYCVAEISPKVYQFTGKTGAEGSTVIGERIRYDYISVKYLGGKSWDQQFHHKNLQMDQATRNLFNVDEENLVLASPLEQGVTYVFTLDFTQGIDKGILSVVIPKGKKVSEKSVDLSGQATKTTLKKGYRTFPTTKGHDQTTEKLLYNEYLLITFGYAFRQDSEQSEGTDESGEKEWQSDRSDALAYELEYILQGKGSDKENLESVLFRLFLLRISGNYSCLSKDMGRMAEAEALAVTISAQLLMPEAVEALKLMIVVSWSGGESVMDLRCLLDGRKVPLVKSADKWVVSLSQLPLLLTDGGSVRGNDSGEGVGYSDYIRMFLF